jgi:hypothetical protein
MPLGTILCYPLRTPLASGFAMPRDKHWIDLDSATQLTANWRKKHSKSPKAMRFERTAFERILKLTGCKGIRIYYAQKDDGEWTFVMVGTNAKGQDMTEGELAQETWPCPPMCDPESPLGGAK